MNRGDRRPKLFGHLFSGRDTSLVADAASAAYRRSLCDCCRRGGVENVSTCGTDPFTLFLLHHPRSPNSLRPAKTT